MRIAIVGKMQSGRTTAATLLLHQIHAHFDEILLLDGKGTQLHGFNDAASFYGPDAVAEAAEALEAIAAELPSRHSGETQKRYLIVADDFQHFSRASVSKHGTKIKKSIDSIAESGLGDFLILTVPRLTGNVSKPTQVQLSATVELIGNGAFFLQAAGLEATSGTLHAEPPPTVAELPATCAEFPAMLGTVQAAEAGKATLYLSRAGGGKTHALRAHGAGDMRRIYVNMELAQGAMLKDIIEKCGAPLPGRANVAQLRDVACLALSASPSMLLLDNVHAASKQQRLDIEPLMAASAACALSANEPTTPASRRNLNPLLTRCRTVELKPLPDAEAAELLWQTIERDGVDDPAAVERKILRSAGGNPGDVVKLANRIERGDKAELREVYAPVRRINIGWVVLVMVVAMAMASRRYIDGYMALALVTAMTIVLRPLIYKTMNASD